MRPPSIVMFERLFLASLGLSLLSLVINYDTIMDDLAKEPALEQLGMGSGLVIGMMVGSLAIYVLLWFLVARKASVVAKWILIVLVAFGVATSLPALLASSFDLNLMLAIAVYALEIAAIVNLFREDAKAWLGGEWNRDTATLD